MVQSLLNLFHLTYSSFFHRETCNSSLDHAKWAWFDIKWAWSYSFRVQLDSQSPQPSISSYAYVYYTVTDSTIYVSRLSTWNSTNIPLWMLKLISVSFGASTCTVTFVWLHPGKVPLATCMCHACKDCIILCHWCKGVCLHDIVCVFPWFSPWLASHKIMVTIYFPNLCSCGIREQGSSKL